MPACAVASMTRGLIIFVSGFLFGILLFQFNRNALVPRAKDDFYSMVRRSNLHKPGTYSLEISSNVKDDTRNETPHVVVTAISSAAKVLMYMKNVTELKKTFKAKTTTTKPIVDKRTLKEKYPPELYKGNPPLNDKVVVPKIVHYAWYGSSKRNNLRFHHFISMLSAYKHIQPTKIMFWHETVPEGQWWDEINRRAPIIELKYRKGPTSIHGKHIRVAEHKSDIVRLEAIMDYGGIYTDLDVIVLKSFDPLLRYNTTMGYEMGNGLCNGLMVSRPHAKFLEIWYEAYKSFNDGQWAYHSVLLPAKLAKDYPRLIHTEEKTMHRPNWTELKWLYETGKIYDWSKNYAVHLWYRFHKKDHNPEDIKTLNTTMGQLFRYIYYGKKDLIH